MEDGIISFEVQDVHGQSWKLEAPTDMSLSVMEVMKGEGVPVLATCGGMALCATCHVQVIQTTEPLPSPSGDELDMLETLPVLTKTSRLSCQLRISTALDGAILKFLGEDNA